MTKIKKTLTNIVTVLGFALPHMILVGLIGKALNATLVPFIPSPVMVLVLSLIGYVLTVWGVTTLLFKAKLHERLSLKLLDKAENKPTTSSKAFEFSINLILNYIVLAAYYTLFAIVISLVLYFSFGILLTPEMLTPAILAPVQCITIPLAIYLPFSWSFAKR